MLYLSGQYYYASSSFNIKILIGIAVLLPEPAILVSVEEHLTKGKGIEGLLPLLLSTWDHSEQQTTCGRKFETYNWGTLRDKFPNSWTNPYLVREIKPPSGEKQRHVAENVWWHSDAWVLFLSHSSNTVPLFTLKDKWPPFCLSLLSSFFVKSLATKGHKSVRCNSPARATALKRKNLPHCKGSDLDSKDRDLI